MNFCKTSIAIIALSVACPHSASAAVLIDDNFTNLSAGAQLDGSSPDTTGKSYQWIGTASTASTGIYGNSSSTGVVMNVVTANTSDAIDLGNNFFSTNPAGIYTLSLTAGYPAGTGSSTGWFGFGFASNTFSDSTTLSSSTGGTGWMLYRNNGAVNSYAGPGTTGSTIFTGSTSGGVAAGDAAGTGPFTLNLVLNTTGTQWTLATYLNGTQLGSTYTYTTNPDLEYIAIGDGGSGTGVGNITNITFSSAPEPSVPAFLVTGVGCLLFLRNFRRRAVR